MSRRTWPLLAMMLVACTGTEHPIFLPIEPFVAAPAPTPDAGRPEPPVLEDPPAALDAGPDLDAGANPDPPLDRTVKFAWTETLPGKGTCRQGQYIGRFTCVTDADAASSLFPLPPSGQLVFTLEGSVEEQILSITEGSVKDEFGLFFIGGLRGTLQCTDKQFQAVSVEGISYSLFGTSTFEATLEGEFDDQSLVIEGDFTMVDPEGQRCSGTFEVGAAP